MHKTVITSFSPYGYNLYGRNFIETFDRYWPKDVRLVAFTEDGQPPLVDLVERDRNFAVEPIGNAEGWPEFYSAIKNFPLMCGDTGRGYSIDYDARMARKTFMQAHAVRHYGGKVFWIDADSITHAPVPADFLDTVLPDDKFCTFLGRDGIDFYTESGFLGFNSQHPIAAKFINAYVKMFTTGAVFTFERWHDCIAFDAIRKQAEREEPGAFNNLGAGVDPGPGLQVFINSVLGKYMDHLKGPRKSAGRSPLKDLTVIRPEPYWAADAAQVATR